MPTRRTCYNFGGEGTGPAPEADTAALTVPSAKLTLLTSLADSSVATSTPVHPLLSYHHHQAGLPGLLNPRFSP